MTVRVIDDIIYSTYERQNSLFQACPVFKMFKHVAQQKSLHVTNMLYVDILIISSKCSCRDFFWVFVVCKLSGHLVGLVR